MSRSISIQEAIQLGIQHHNAGQLQQAEQLYRQVLQQVPNQPDALHLLGLIALQVGRPDTAMELIRQAIAATPNNALFRSNLGEACRLQGLLDDAEASCRKAIELSPAFGSAYINLGTVLQDKGRSDDAEAALRRALELEPGAVQALSTLGNVLSSRGDFDGAIEMGRRAVEASPSYPLAHNNLATALESKDLLAEAEVEYGKAVELNPNFVEALNNLGNVIRRQGRHLDALPFWERAVAARPDYADGQWNLGLGYLALGDYERGWPLYESRFRCSHTRKYFRHYPGIPRWTGFDLNGKSILLYPEQGYGDVIQFARFLPQLAEMGANVLLHLPTELIDIMKGVPGIAQIIGPDDELPAFNTHQAILSLPSVLKLTLANLPNKVPYIEVDPERKAAWAGRIVAEPGQRKVGLVYSGRAVPDPLRSCRFAELVSLADAKAVTFFSLQLGEATDELRDAPPNMQIVDVHEHIKVFADTAAAIANLDLLISIDTAAAHIAGALGKPVWTMIPFAPDYRWLLGRDDSPWYPTMRLFRQTERKSWKEVIARVRGELMNWNPSPPGRGSG